MLKTFQDLAAQAVDLAIKAGADDAWARTNQSRSVSFDVRNEKLETVKDSTSRSLKLDIYKDGRYSAHSTTDLRPERLGAWVKDTLAMTRALQPDPYRAIPPTTLFKGAPAVDSLDLHDAGLSAWDNEKRLDLAHRANGRMAGKPGVVSAKSGVWDDLSLVAAASSNGFAGAYAYTSVGLSASCTLKDGDGLAEDWMGSWGRHAAPLYAPERIGDEALARARARLGAGPGPTVTSTMVVDPRAAGRLVGRLLGPASGRAIQQNRSFWKGALGKRQVSPKLTVVDDPTIPAGLRSRPFDGEGIAAKPMPMIEAGVFRNLYINTYYGKKLAIPPTTGASSNRVVSLGQRAGADIIGDVDKGVYVTSWLGGNMDSTTGDFSFGIRGQLIEKGALGKPIGEMNVTGNIVQLFDTLAEVGNDPWPFSSTLAPTLAFENVAFSGK